jgi:hypothetical protein
VPYLAGALRLLLTCAGARSLALNNHGYDQRVVEWIIAAPSTLLVAASPSSSAQNSEQYRLPEVERHAYR